MTLASIVGNGNFYALGIPKPDQFATVALSLSHLPSKMKRFRRAELMSSRTLVRTARRTAL